MLRRVVTTLSGYATPVFIPISLAVPPWVGAMSTSDGLATPPLWKKREFCVVVCPATRTAGVLAESRLKAVGTGC